MTSILNRRFVIWLLSCALAASPLAAGVVMNLRTTDYTGPVPRTESSRMTIGAGVLKMDLESESETGLNHTTVFRGGETPSMTIIDHREKSYLVLDQKSIETVGIEMRMAMQATNLRIGELPPEQQVVVRKMIESQLGRSQGEAAVAPSTVVKTGERDTMSGLPCAQHEVFRRGVKLREVWTAPASELPGGEGSLAMLREMSDFYRAMMSSFARIAAASLGGGLPLGRHPFEDLRHMDGFPVLTYNFAGGRVATEIALLSIEQRRLEPAELEPPADYRRTTLDPR